MLRSAAAGVATTTLALASGCEIHLGSGGPRALPTPPAAETARDALARRASLIASTADVVVSNGGATAGTAERLGHSAREQLEALGGVWQPWTSAAPSGYPTVPPVPTAAPTAGTGDLVEALTESATQAVTTASQSDDTTSARLYACLAVAWLLGATALEPTAVELPGRTPSSLTAPLPGDVLMTYDAARYALQEVAARAGEPDRGRASADAAYAGAIVSACLALGGQDSRLSAYAPPTSPDDGASIDITWARRTWGSVLEAEIAGISATGGQATSAAVNAATNAGLRARAWGAAVDDPLPGHASG